MGSVVGVPLWALGAVAVLAAAAGAFLVWVLATRRGSVGRSSMPQRAAGFDAPGAPVSTESDPPPRVLVLGDSDNPAVQVFRPASRLPAFGRPLPVTSGLKTALGPLLQQAPTLALNVGRAAQNVFVVQFAPEVAKHLADGSLKMMEAVGGGLRASAVDASGKIAGNGSLYANNGPRAVSAGLAVWQVLAIVTAQKYLADIDAKLAAVEKGIDAIKGMLEADYFATLRADFSYLQSINRYLNEQVLRDTEVASFLNQLEDIDRSCRRVAGVFHARLEQNQRALADMCLKGVGLDENVNQLAENVAEHAKLAEGVLQAVYVKAAAAQLRCALPVSRELAASRLEEARDELRVLGDASASYKHVLDKQLPTLKGRFSFKKTDHGHQRKIRHQFRDASMRLRGASDELDSGFANVRKLLGREAVESARHTTLAVSLAPNGDVQSVTALPNAVCAPAERSLKRRASR